MKKRNKPSKKLTLKKITVSTLNTTELLHIKGGLGTHKDGVCSTKTEGIECVPTTVK